MFTSFRFRENWLADTGGVFAWRSALALLSACKIAYHPPWDAERVARDEWGMEAQAFSVDDSHGIIIANPRIMVVAFGGADGVADWLGDLQIAPRHVPALGGAVHSGFLDAYERVAIFVDDAVARVGDRALWFTGHSLGGALAVLAALNHPDSRIAGLMTFGQPRLLGARPAQQAAARFGPAYHRFVNLDDIVTRAPPGYSHAGRRVHFGGAGADSVVFGAEDLESSIERETTQDLPDRELSAAEFVALQETINAIEAEIETRPPLAMDFEGESDPIDTEVLLDASVEGLIPGVSSHRIDAYLAEVNARATTEIANEGLHETFAHRRQVSFQREIIAPETSSGQFEEALVGLESTAASEPSDPAERYLVRLTTLAWEPPAGVELHSIIGNIASVSASSAGIDRLVGDSRVVSLEASREAGIEDIATSVPHVKGTAIHNRPNVAERGDAALVGIIDTGIDILHEAFNDANGDSRILAVWLQRDTTGPSPHAVDPQAFSQKDGTLYLAQDIRNFRRAYAVSGAAPPIGLRDEFSGHGTHVASIAAGRSFAGVGDGMAPDAGIIVVAAHTSTDPANPAEPRSIGYSSSHVEALAFLKAASQGGTKVLHDARPMAINVSLGMNAGAHDGQTTLEAAFDSITGSGRDPGLAIIKSAGNERSNAGHASAQAALGAFVEVAWASENNNRKHDYIEAWFEPGVDIEFTLIMPDLSRVGPVNFNTPDADRVTGAFVCRMSLSECHSDNGHNRLAISVDRKLGGRIPHGRWSIEMLARQVVSNNATVHFWAERVADRSIRFEQPDPLMTLSIPATARTVITVGACNSAFPMRLLGASSLGLTRDGRPKPEICAPGEAIIAAQAAGATDVAVPKSGTSMAAPHVTGAVALAFSAIAKAGKRQVNAVQILHKLRLTTQNFSHIHNPGFGSGILDAEKFFDEMT